MQAIRDLFLSKKFIVALLTLVGSVAAYKGWHVDPMVILPLATPVFVYLGAQGWADSGKERAKVEGATAIQLQTMAQAHDMARDMARAGSPPAKTSEAGFVRARLILVTGVVSVVVGMSLYTPATMITGCSHPVQSTLRVGQCLLDTNTLSDVLEALAKPDYLAQVVAVGLQHADDLVECALKAIETQPSGTGSGSGSGSGLPALTRALTQPRFETLSDRAREALAARRTSDK